MANQIPPKECPVCLETKVVLKALPCGHKYCLECLETHRRNESSFTCPHCRESVTVQDSAAELPSRYFGLLKCQAVNCEKERRTDRIRWCEECHKWLCVPCAEDDAHFFLSHSIRDFDSLHSVKAACAKIEAETQSTTNAGIDRFLAKLRTSLQSKLENRLEPVAVQLRSTFGLGEATFGTGGLSPEEADGIAEKALSMMGVVVEKEAMVSREMVVAAVDSLFTPDRIGPILEEPTDMTGDGPGLLVMKESRVGLFYPFSDTESTTDQLQSLSGSFFFAASRSASGSVLVTGGLEAPEGFCSLLDPTTLTLSTDGLPPPHLATRRFAHVSALIGDTNFVVGGVDKQSQRRLQTCFALRNSAWLEVAPSPELLGWTSAAVCDEKLFVMGSSTKQFLQLDPESNRWIKLQERNYPWRFYPNFLAFVNNAVYAVEYAGLHIYLPETGTWSQGPQLPHEADVLSQCGGRLLALDDDSSLVQTYEPRTESWEVCKEMRLGTGPIYACVDMS